MGQPTLFAYVAQPKFFAARRRIIARVYFRRDYEIAVSRVESS